MGVFFNTGCPVDLASLICLICDRIGPRLMTIIFIVGIALIAIAAKEKGKDNGTPSTKAAAATPSDKATKCDYSDEAKRVGLGEFLDKVKSTYYKLHPYEVYDDPDVTLDRIKEEYVAYDPTPSTIKARTDTSLDLLKEISDKTINPAALKQRERKVLAQVANFFSFTNLLLLIRGLQYRVYIL